MARASFRTMLSLDRYAKIMGVNPAHFSGGGHIELPDGRVLFYLDNAQNDIWPQYNWQNQDQCSREELAMQIKNAEYEVVRHLRYFPTPTWIECERHDMPSFYRPDFGHNNARWDTGYFDPQIDPEYAYFIAGGRRHIDKKDTVAVSYSDPDGDGWSELATFTLNACGCTDYEHIKPYFKDRNAAPEYEIREPKTKTVAGGIITWTFNTWQMVDPEATEVLPTNDTDGKFIDFADMSNFVTQVDVYREHNDDSQCQAHFYCSDNGCQTCGGQDVEHDGFIYQVYADGSIVPLMGTYDAATECWVAQYDCQQCVYPYAVELWYYSGMRKRPNKPQYSDDYLPDEIALAIAYLATSRLERVFYANNNATALAASLREELTVATDGNFRTVPNDVLTNPFGVRRGEWMAWKFVNQFMERRFKGAAI